MLGKPPWVSRGENRTRRCPAPTSPRTTDQPLHPCSGGGSSIPVLATRPHRPHSHEPGMPCVASQLWEKVGGGGGGEAGRGGGSRRSSKPSLPLLSASMAASASFSARSCPPVHPRRRASAWPAQSALLASPLPSPCAPDRGAGERGAGVEPLPARGSPEVVTVAGVLAVLLAAALVSAPSSPSGSAREGGDGFEASAGAPLAVVDASMVPSATLHSAIGLSSPPCIPYRDAGGWVRFQPAGRQA